MQETVRFADKTGKKRKGVKTTCRTCDKEFITRKDRISKYCSMDCRKNKPSDVKMVDLICDWCSSQFTRPKSQIRGSKSGLYFCTRECKDKAQRIGGLEEIQPTHYNDGKMSYRDKFTEEEMVCSRCGYDEFATAIDIHHKDHDRSNNDKSNLVPLCANCHRAYHHGYCEI